MSVIEGKNPATYDPRLSDLRLLSALSTSLLTSRSPDEPGTLALAALAKGEALSGDALRAAILTAHAVRDALLPLAQAHHWKVAGLSDQEALAQADTHRLLREDWLPAQIAALHRHPTDD